MDNADTKSKGKIGRFEIPSDLFDLGFLQRISSTPTNEVTEYDKAELQRVLEKKTDEDYNCLHFAAHRGFDGFVSKFYELGGDLDQHSKQGWTAVHEASLQGFVPCIQALLSRGANVNSIANINQRDCTPLVVAIISNQVEVAKFLLLNGADPSIPDKSHLNQTTAHRAAEYSPEGLQLLL